ncbi:MAG: terminase TerL endonuclease subunit [Gammaproteobacteria bacterium]
MKKRKTRSRAISGRRPKKSSKPVFAETGHASNYCQLAYDFAAAAIADRRHLTHCRWLQKAARRFLDDLKRAKTAGCYFSFDAWEGNNVCDFIEKLPHIEGSWATKTIRLEPPQIFILVNVFGFRRRDTRARRFTDVYIEMARKGAKSTLTAGIGLYCLTSEHEPGPQVVIGATTGSQALKVFNPALRMVQRTRELREAFDVKAWAHSISCGINDGFIQPINAKSSTQDGWNPHVGILDELHAHKDRGLHDVIKSSFGSRKNPLMWRITTAGYNSIGVCYEQHRLVENILDGIFSADHYFGVIFTLDEGDDEYDEKVWIKANPMLGITPSLESMRSYAKEAKQSPDSRGEFLTKRLNRWTTAHKGWLNMEQWKRCGKTIDLDALQEVEGFGGLDLAATSDITAFVLVWLVDGRLKIHARCYLPEETVAPRSERGNVPYQVWAVQKFLTLTPGNVFDDAFVQRDIEAAMRRFKIKEIAFDPWNATSVVNRLQENGAPMVEFRQGAKSYHPAMKEFERLLKGAKVDHDGSPVLTWSASNIVARRDQNENMAPDKKNSLEKIDPMVAMLMALGRATVMHEPAVSKSVYDERGIRTL